MSRRAALHASRIIPFILISAVLYLASRYFGGLYIKAARFWFLIFLADQVMLVGSAVTLKYSQLFTHGDVDVQKGEIIQYQLNITTASLLPAPMVRASFARIHQRDRQVIPDRMIRLGPGDRDIFSRDIYAGLRGIYTMGVAKLVITGFTGLFSISLPIWPKTFYIYPRLLQLRLAMSRHLPTYGHLATRTGTHGEYHTFSGLHDYRSGETTRHISWKRFAQLGIPVIKDFDTLGSSRIHLFLDRRRVTRNPICEDTAIEAALALIWSACSQNQAITIHGFPGWEGYTLTREEEVRRLHETTLTMQFDSHEILSGFPEGSNRNSPIYIVSPLTDFQLLNPDFWDQLESGHLLAVTEDMDDRQRDQAGVLIDALVSQGTSITVIHAGNELEERLVCAFS